ncbi:hypothetical protein [Pantoea agglomerans]
MKLHVNARRALSRVIRYSPALSGMILFTLLFQVRADVQDPQPAGITLVSSDARALLRINCMDGNSLFISLAVPSGSISPDILTVSGAAGTRWITGGPEGQSVNIAYAAAPRALLRRMLADHPGKLTFGRRGPDFDARALAAWYDSVPAACR